MAFHAGPIPTENQLDASGMSGANQPPPPPPPHTVPPPCIRKPQKHTHVRADVCLLPPLRSQLTALCMGGRAEILQNIFRICWKESRKSVISLEPKIVREHCPVLMPKTGVLLIRDSRFHTGVPQKPLISASDGPRRRPSAFCMQNEAGKLTKARVTGLQLKWHTSHVKDMLQFFTTNAPAYGCSPLNVINYYGQGAACPAEGLRR